MSGPRLLSGLLIAATCAAAAFPVHAQRRTAGPPSAGEAGLMTELGRLREAAKLESAGDLAGAERVVREVLDANPLSLSGLLTLERVLMLQGRPAGVLTAVDRLLERDPVSVIGHQVRLRVHDQLDDVAGIERTIRTWAAATPHLETPYREGAVVWRGRGEHRSAIALLEQGRERIRMKDALALELGDAHVAVGNAGEAAAAWGRAVGEDGRGYMLVQRRLQPLADGGAAIIPLLIEQLGGKPITTGRQKAATLLAIEAGLDTRAYRLARDLVGIARVEERETLLVELARRADGAGVHRVAAWAYSRLLDDAREPGALLAIRARVAELALLAGDTALAAETYRQLEDAAAEGSPQRRQAMALRIQLTARDGSPDSAAAAFAQFRAAYPQAPESDATADLIALRYLDAGDLAGAERVLTGVAGPRSARTRGRIYLRRGDIAAARHEMLAAAPQLKGADATEAIALAALLTRVSPSGGELVAAVTAASSEQRLELIADAAAAADSLPARERSAILDFLAVSAARAGSPTDAAALRRRIVDELPQAHEAPAALLELALAAATAADGAEEARVLLEKLILEYPRSALLPRARSELQRIGRTGESSEGRK